MTTKAELLKKVEQRMDELETMLCRQEDINAPVPVILKMDGLSKYFSIMSEEDRDFFNAAKLALEEQLEWKEQTS